MFKFVKVMHGRLGSFFQTLCTCNSS